jgi:hypothetical protein
MVPSLEERAAQRSIPIFLGRGTVYFAGSAASFAGRALQRPKGLWQARTVRARGSIEAAVGNPQTIDGAAADDMRFYYVSNIGLSQAAVPYRFGLNHDGGTMLALVQASGLVGADCGEYSVQGQLRFEGALKIGCAGRVAATAGMSVGALVGADKDVFFEFRHGNDNYALSSAIALGSFGVRKGPRSGPGLIH